MSEGKRFLRIPSTDTAQTPRLGWNQSSDISMFSTSKFKSAEKRCILPIPFEAKPKSRYTSIYLVGHFPVVTGLQMWLPMDASGFLEFHTVQRPLEIDLALLLARYPPVERRQIDDTPCHLLVVPLTDFFEGGILTGHCPNHKCTVCVELETCDIAALEYKIDGHHRLESPLCSEAENEKVSLSVQGKGKDYCVPLVRKITIPLQQTFNAEGWASVSQYHIVTHLLLPVDLNRLELRQQMEDESMFIAGEDLRFMGTEWAPGWMQINVAQLSVLVDFYCCYIRVHMKGGAKAKPELYTFENLFSVYHLGFFKCGQLFKNTMSYMYVESMMKNIN